MTVDKQQVERIILLNSISSDKIAEEKDNLSTFKFCFEIILFIGKPFLVKTSSMG